MPDLLPEGAAMPTAVAADPIKLQTVVHSVALAIMLGWILHIGASVLVPMVLALMLSYVVVGLSRLINAVPGVGAWLPSWLSVLLSTVLIGHGIVQLVILFAANVAAFGAQSADFQANALAMIQSGAAYVGFAGDVSWETLRRDVLGPVNLQALIRSGLSSSAALLGGLLFVLLNLIFMLLERRSLDAKLGAMSSDPTRVARLRVVVTDINTRIGRYLAVKTMINVVLGLICFGIMLAFGLEFAVLWAIVIALLNYIPYLGSWLGVGFPVLFAIVQFGDFETVLMLVLALSAAQFLVGNVFEPFVMGNSLDLSPYVILIGLTVWSSLWGVAGAIVSVPITAVIVIVLSEFKGARAIAVLLSRNGDLAARTIAAPRGQE